jgi:Thiamine pyrophosphate enzyme, N-terminal TPP binding domain
MDQHTGAIMSKKVADQIAEILVVAGVKRIYGVVGDSLNGITDSLRRQGKIDWVHPRRAAGAGRETQVSHGARLERQGRTSRIDSSTLKVAFISRRLTFDPRN